MFLSPSRHARRAAPPRGAGAVGTYAEWAPLSWLNQAGLIAACGFLLGTLEFRDTACEVLKTIAGEQSQWTCLPRGGEGRGALPEGCPRRRGAGAAAAGEPGGAANGGGGGGRGSFLAAGRCGSLCTPHVNVVSRLQNILATCAPGDVAPQCLPSTRHLRSTRHQCDPALPCWSPTPHNPTPRRPQAGGRRGS